MRSVLCVPGHDEHKVEKCRSYGADVIMFDLEDGVPDDQKAKALDVVAGAIRPGDAVRICAAWHPQHRAQVVKLANKATVVWVPKVNRPGQLDVPMDADVWALIESPLSVLNVSQIAASWRCSGLAFGAADFQATLMTRRATALVDHARAQVALTAKAFGLACIDTPCFTLRPEVLAAEVERAVALGFTGKGAIHPSQVDRINAAFAPEMTTAAAPNDQGITRDGDVVIGPPMRVFG